MMRFFAQPQCISNKTIELSAEDSAHIRSLRLRPDELFVVCDGNGYDYTCCLGEIEPGFKTGSAPSVAQIVKRKKSNAEPSVRCTMYIAYAKGERLDYAVQKSVELGAHEIALFHCKRCIVRPNDVARKLGRLQKIALEAAKQSGRGIVPKVSDIGAFGAALDAAANRSDLTILCYEDEKNLSLMTVLEHFFPFVVLFEGPMDKVKSISVITGPEGGFEPSEAKRAQAKEIPIVSLGPRILRSETAPVAALTAIMYHTRNL